MTQPNHDAFDEDAYLADTERYLRIERWLQCRYCDKKTGLLLIRTGSIPSIYSRLNSAFHEKYMRKYWSLNNTLTETLRRYRAQG